jgi:hypothetical protein
MSTVWQSDNNEARCMCEVKCRIAVAKAAFDKNKIPFSNKLELNLRKNLMKY